MGDPTNRNDPEYSQDPHYVWSGGRWQYVQSPGATPTTNTTRVTGTTVGTGSDWDLSEFGRMVNNFFSGKDPDAAAKANAVLSQGIDATPLFNKWDARFKEYGNQAPVQNPYNAGIADQSRGAQFALLKQMQGQMNGPSIANMQGQRALGQSGQQALMGASMGGPYGRAGMLQAGQVGGGLAGDVGQARLAELMRVQAGMGGLAGSLRGGDLRSAEASAQAGLGADKLTAGRQSFALGQGTGLAQTELNSALENYRFGKRIEGDKNVKAADTRDQVLGTLQTYLSMLAMQGKGGGKP